MICRRMERRMDEWTARRMDGPYLCRKLCRNLCPHTSSVTLHRPAYSTARVLFRLSGSTKCIRRSVGMKCDNWEGHMSDILLVKCPARRWRRASIVKKQRGIWIRSQSPSGGTPSSRVIVNRKTRIKTSATRHAPTPPRSRAGRWLERQWGRGI